MASLYNVKLDNDELAVDDVNIIRRRAGLSGDDFYTFDDLKENERVLDVVLEERRLELAFEDYRPLDLFGNIRLVFRAYPESHSRDRFNQVILLSTDSVINFIPEREIIVNPNLEQILKKITNETSNERNFSRITEDNLDLSDFH